MIVKETDNEQEIRTILCNKEIYDAISDDYSPNAEDFIIPFDGYQYIGGYVGSEIIALMVYHSFRDGRTCHVQVLPQFRNKYAMRFGQESLLFRGNDSLYAEIPDLYKNVLDFAHKFGFTIIETVKNDYIKNGDSYNMNILRMD